MGKNKSHFNPMSLLKAEAKEGAEVEEEAEEEDNSSNIEMTTGKTIRVEDSPSEEDGNPEVEEEEVEEASLTEAQTSGNPE